MKYKCSYCGETELELFYASTYTRCKACDKERVKARGIRNKRFIAILKSEGCRLCGELDPVVIELHHIDKKSQYLTQLRWYSKEAMIKEALKCVPLCANCHTRVHRGTRSLENVRRYHYDELMSIMEAAKHGNS